MSDGLSLPVRCVNCKSDLEVAMYEERDADGYRYAVAVEPCRVCMEERTKKRGKDASDSTTLRKLRDKVESLGSIVHVDSETIRLAITELTWLEIHDVSLLDLVREAVRRGLVVS